MASPSNNQINIQGNEYLFPDGKLYTILADDMLNPLKVDSFGVSYKAQKKDGESIVKKINKTYVTKECITEIPNLESYGEDIDNYYIAIPYYSHGTLTQFILASPISNQKEGIEYFREICEGIRQLIEQGLHCTSLTSEDIAVFSCTNESNDYSFVIKSELVEKRESKEIKSYTPIELATLAPEAIAGVKSNNAFIFSLGCILYKMLTGAEPFQGSSMSSNKKMKEQIHHQVKSKVQLLDGVINILEGCLRYESNKRYSLVDLISALEVQKISTEEFEQISQKSPQILNLREIRVEKEVEGKKESTIGFLSKSMKLVLVLVLVFVAVIVLEVVAYELYKENGKLKDVIIKKESKDGIMKEIIKVNIKGSINEVKPALKETANKIKNIGKNFKAQAEDLKNKLDGIKSQTKNSKTLLNSLLHKNDEEKKGRKVDM